MRPVVNATTTKEVGRVGARIRLVDEVRFFARNIVLAPSKSATDALLRAIGGI